jgi:hypothetical protein
LFFIFLHRTMASLSWDLASLSVVAEDSPSSPLASSRTGSKLEPLRGVGKLVSLVLVRKSDAASSFVCTGYIGSGKAKLCLAPDCGIRSHQGEKFDFPEGVDELLFIETGNIGAAWASPFLEPSAFGRSWERYRDERRSVTSWQTLFNAISSDPGMTGEDVVAH